jgi:hypothetical protein
MKRNNKLLILASNHRLALMFAEDMGLTRENYTYIHSLNQIKGRTNGVLIKATGYYQNREIDKILRYARYHNIRILEEA